MWPVVVSHFSEQQLCTAWCDCATDPLRNHEFKFLWESCLMLVLRKWPCLLGLVGGVITKEFELQNGSTHTPGWCWLLIHAVVPSHPSPLLSIHSPFFTVLNFTLKYLSHYLIISCYSWIERKPGIFRCSHFITLDGVKVDLDDD